jgi:hypothetical protein
MEFEVQFLSCCLRGLEDGAETPLTFDSEQHDALLALQECLNRTKSQYSKADAIGAMYTAFYMLYYPEDSTALAENVFASPLIAFLAFLCLDPDAGYRSIWHIPPILSRTQCTMRVRGARYLRTTLDEHMKRRNKAKQKPWFEYV